MYGRTHQLDAVAVGVPFPPSVDGVEAASAAIAAAPLTDGLLPVPIVDERELDQRRKDERRARVHPHVDRLQRSKIIHIATVSKIPPNSKLTFMYETCGESELRPEIRMRIVSVLRLGGGERLCMSIFCAVQYFTIPFDRENRRGQQSISKSLSRLKSFISQARASAAKMSWPFLRSVPPT